MSSPLTLDQVLKEEERASETEAKLARLLAAVKHDRQTRTPLAPDQVVDELYVQQLEADADIAEAELRRLKKESWCGPVLFVLRVKFFSDVFLVLRFARLWTIKRRLFSESFQFFVLQPLAQNKLRNHKSRLSNNQKTKLKNKNKNKTKRNNALNFAPWRRAWRCRTRRARRRRQTRAPTRRQTAPNAQPSAAASS